MTSYRSNGRLRLLPSLRLFLFLIYKICVTQVLVNIYMREYIENKMCHIPCCRFPSVALKECFKSFANSVVKGCTGTVSVETIFFVGTLRGALSVEWASAGVEKGLF